MLYKLRSNVKINLHLNVLYKREDGYHEIESIFAPISLCDFIYIDIKDNGVFANSIEDISINTINDIKLQNRVLFDDVSLGSNIKKNLIYKLFLILFDRKIRIPQLSITLIKKIPPGSGVGGGSSNAGTILRFLYHHKIIDFKTAMDIASEVGSDVPFFLYNQIAYVSGRGEKIQVFDFNNYPDLLNLKNIYGIMNFNSFSISTKNAYELLKKPLQNEYIKLAGSPDRHESTLFHQLLSNDLESILRIFKNDFESVIYKQKSELLKIKEWIKKTEPIVVMMTGSGSGIYALYRTKQEMMKSFKYLNDIKSNNEQIRPFKFINIGQWPSGKASDFGSDIRRFESSLPSQ